MINAMIFKITLPNERVAFNSAIIERNDSFALIIDKNIKRYKTYQNLFFRLTGGEYKIEFINKNDLKNIGKPKVVEKRINNKNFFNNFKEFSNGNFFDVTSDVYELSPNGLDKNNEFFTAFGISDNISIIDYKKSEKLLDSNFKLIASRFEFTNTISKIFEEIVNQDFSKAILEVESKDKIDFNNLTMGALNVLTNIKSNIKHLLGKDSINNRVTVALANKCIQTTFYIPKTEVLSIQSEVTNKNLLEIHSANLLVKDDDKLAVASVVEELFKDNEIDNFKFSFQNDLKDINSIKEVNINKSDFDKVDLRNEIKKFKNKEKFKSLTSTFLIDDITGVQSNRKTNFIFIDKLTKEKYRLSFDNQNLTDEKQALKLKLLIIPIKSEIDAKISFDQNSKQNNIVTIDLVTS